MVPPNPRRHAQINSPFSFADTRNTRICGFLPWYSAKRAFLKTTAITLGVTLLAGLTLRGEASGGGTSPGEPREKYAALRKEVEALEQDLLKAQAEAKTDRERQRILGRYVRQRRILATRMLELAGRNLKDVDHDDIIGLKDDLLVAICRDAANAEDLDSLASEQLLRELMAISPHRSVRGMAHFYLAELLEARAFRIGELKRHPEWASSTFRDAEEWKMFSSRGDGELIEDVQKILQQVIENYADLSTAGRRTLGDLAQGRLNRLRNLAVGRTALDIEGKDIDGRRFRLSDYRGKVVLLTFSGNWCGPCRSFYAKERELADRLKDRPFVILSVNTDKDPETLRRSIASGEITWRCWCDEGTDGPITIRCGVYYFPTVFVLDHNGSVRHEQIAGKELDQALDTLLKKAESAKKKDGGR